MHKIRENRNWAQKPKNEKAKKSKTIIRQKNDGRNTYVYESVIGLCVSFYEFVVFMFHLFRLHYVNTLWRQISTLCCHTRFMGDAYKVQFPNLCQTKIISWQILHLKRKPTENTEFKKLIWNGIFWTFQWNAFQMFIKHLNDYYETGVFPCLSEAHHMHSLPFTCLIPVPKM